MSVLGAPELITIIGIFVPLGFGALLLLGGLRSGRSKSAQRALIERLSPDELLSLLRSPNGERLIEALGDGGSPGRAILATVQRGIVAVFAGAGLFAASVHSDLAPIPAALAILLVFVGAGLLTAAFVSYRLSKSWNLLDRPREND